METQKPVGRVRRSLSYILESWLQDFLNNNCEKLPNKDIINLPDSFSSLKFGRSSNQAFQILTNTKILVSIFFVRLGQSIFQM
jgi:hypothetical protein